MVAESSVPQQPDASADEREPFLHCADGRRDVLRARMRRGRIRTIATVDTTKEAASTANAVPVPRLGHERPAERRAGEAKCDRPDELIE